MGNWRVTVMVDGGLVTVERWMVGGVVWLNETG